MMSTKVITEFEEAREMPVLALRGLSVFPGTLINFDVERASSVEALNKSMDGDRIIFLVAQKDIAKEMPLTEDIYKIGTVCRLRQTLRQPGRNVVRVMAEGIGRGQLKKMLDETPCMYAEISPLPDISEKLNVKTEAFARRALNLFGEYAEVTGGVSPGSVLNVLAVDDIGYMSNYIAQSIYLKPVDKQALLEEVRPSRRMSMLCNVMARELALASIQRDLAESTQEQIGRSQKEYYLREQLKVIQSQLGDDSGTDDIAEYKARILELKLNEDVEKKLLKELNRLSKQSYSSSEASVIRNYLDTCLDIPWNKRTKETIDVVKARKQLDNEHFGLDKVKERITEYLAVRRLVPNMKGGVLCLLGPPGTGKTSVAMSVAKATNRKLCRVALGGVHDEAEIRGHRKTYVGAMPGRIISGIVQAGSMNPVMVLDEIDKLGSDHRGDPAAALLEALDGEQNMNFRDNFLELSFDLSDVLFITTANNRDTIPRALLDRMEIIELTSYTDEEKLQIAKRHILPKQRKKHGLTGSNLKLSDDAIRAIATGYTRESGVRNLERQVAKLCRKCAHGMATGKFKSLNIRTSELEEYLGPERYKQETLWGRDEVGLVHGLAWTSVGGDVLDIEIGVTDGSGKIELTGNLGHVMKESASAAISYIRSRALSLGIEPDFYKKKDIHIHFPAGAVPKDGPSAGIAICIGVISALSGVPVRGDVAMTGEISLRGRILRIGGLKEKTMAAMRNGVSTVIIPASNESDLDEIDSTVRCALTFVTAEHMDDILDVALVNKPKPKAKKQTPDTQKKVSQRQSADEVRIGQ